MAPEEAKRIWDAANAARRIRKFTAGMDFDRFGADELVRAAVERQFEIIGEALGKLDATNPEWEKDIPDLRKIVGLRNRLIHGYDSIDEEILWNLTEREIPALISQLGNLLHDHGSDIDED